MINKNKEKGLMERMGALGIREEDIVEKFIRSRGHGGQNINKTSSCVYLKHVPTGIEVKMQKDRSQSVNRFLARRLLANKVEDLVLGEKSLVRQEIERIRRQKRKRSRRAQERILKNKKIESVKKGLRGNVHETDE
ncbi:MAG: peptide chain release factor-like protein [Deltaproteobacteria bacterium]|nr:peptide chain release factor-like protein [Deltaproteobacteria bacterium]MCL5276973.1 peptide chain release factor-like protein [Deltaproteobacteria bacterium]